MFGVEHTCCFEALLHSVIYIERREEYNYAEPYESEKSIDIYVVLYTVMC